MKTYSEFHDGVFNGLLIEKDAAHFFLETSQHEKFVLTAKQMSALRLNDVFAGNIIFDVEVFDLDEISINDFLEAQPHRHGEHAAFEKARDQKLQLLRINPSYGANMVAVTRSVEVCLLEQWGRLLPTAG
jgi:hypothetical protein